MQIKYSCTEYVVKDRKKPFVSVSTFFILTKIYAVAKSSSQEHELMHSKRATLVVTILKIAQF